MFIGQRRSFGCRKVFDILCMLLTSFSGFALSSDPEINSITFERTTKNVIYLRNTNKINIRITQFIKKTDFRI